MQSFTQNRTKKLTTLAMLIAMAFLVGAAFRIRGIFAVAPFLTYDPKDVVILIGGFLFGPVSAFLMSWIVALIEMVTISNTGPIGALMNTVASASFTCTAAFIYLRKRSIQGAVIGLSVACVVATAVMLLWNYFIIPLYSPFVTREAVIGMMLPALLPFNLIKTSLNAVLAILLYKRVAVALRATRMFKDALPHDEKKSSSKLNIAVTISAAVIAIALIVLIFVIRAA